MAKYSITAIIGAVTDKLEKGLAKAKGAAKDLGSKAGSAMSGMGGKIKGAVGKLAAFGDTWQKAMGHPAVQAAQAAAKAIVDFGVVAVQTAGKIDAGMNEVFSLLPEMSRGAKDEITKEMLALSAEMGKMPDDMIGSLYNALSAGVPKDNVFDFLRVASKASIAGVSSTQEAVGALTTIMNGYRMPTEKAGEVSDVLFTIIKNGVTTMPELAANIGKVTPMAASLGVEIDTVGAAFAELTKNLGPGKSAEAGTQLKAMLAELGKAGSVAAENFERIAGKSFPAFIESGGTLKDALQMMSKDAASTNGRISDLFGSIEAGGAALILSANNAAGFTEQLDAMAKKAGATDTAYATVDQGFSRMMEKLMSGLESFKYTVGKALGPVVDSLMPTLLRGLKMVGDLPWNLVGEVLGEIMKSLEPLMDALFEAVRALFPALVPLIKLSIATFLPLIPIFVLFINLLAKLAPVIVKVLELVAIWVGWAMKLVQWISRMVNAVFKGGDAVKKESAAISEEMMDLLKEVKNWVMSAIKWGTKIYDWFKGVLRWMGRVKDRLFESYSWLESAFNFVMDLAGVLWNYFKDKLYEGINEFVAWYHAIKDTIMEGEGFIFDVLRGVWNYVSDLFEDVMALIRKAIGLFKKAADAAGWLAKKLGLAKEETVALNDELEKTERKEEKIVNDDPTKGGLLALGGKAGLTQLWNPDDVLKDRDAARRAEFEFKTQKAKGGSTTSSSGSKQVKVSIDESHNRTFGIIVRQLGQLIHLNRSMDKTLKGKFKNQ